MAESTGLLTTKQVGERYGISPNTLRYWRHRGEGPASFSMGKKVMYRLADVEQWIEHQHATTSRGGVTA